MNPAVRKIADAVLYEGYLLYPYRTSSVKNQQRWTFGALYPRALADRCAGRSQFVSQFLIESTGEPELDVLVRFRDAAEAREVGIGRFAFEGGDGRSVEGAVDLQLARISPSLFKATLSVTNTASNDDQHSVLEAAHAILEIKHGVFVSLTDPPPEFCDEAAGCRNDGVWPVLTGEPGSRTCLLISPIILYDYPQIAPESAGDLFDGTEIDEILSLRILTLTDGEKIEIRGGDERARALLHRTESLSRQDWLRLHGARRDPNPLFKRGDRVRLRPRKRADIFDLALAGQIAEIDSIETDFEGRMHLAVVIENDPGKDLGVMRQPGHRFFFSPEEVEAIP